MKMQAILFGRPPASISEARTSAFQHWLEPLGAKNRLEDGSFADFQQ